MITEDYVSFETAKLLKEKGFDEECYTVYSGEDLLLTQGYTNSYYDRQINSHYDKFGTSVITASTLQMAMKWLRETHNIAIETEWEHLWYAYIKPMTSKPFEEDYYQCESSKYEEACETAIKYCLENLI